MTTTTPATKRGVDRLSDGLLVLIVLLVGVMAGAASFSHVHEWTMDNSPTGTPSWFGWSNAVITELIPTAALITIAARHRTHGRIGYPMFLLIAAVGFSLTAQLAVAEPTVFGWLVSALPALAFFALSKLVFTAAKPTPAATTPEPAAPLAASTHTVEPPTLTLPVTDTPRLDPAPAATLPDALSAPAKKTTPRRTPAKKTTTPAKKATPRTRSTATTTDPSTSTTTPAVTTATRQTLPAAPEQAPAPSGIDIPVATLDAAPPLKAPAPAALVTRARNIADDYLTETGTPITSGPLAVRLRVSSDIADQVLALLALDPNRSRQPVMAANGATAETLQP